MAQATSGKSRSPNYPAIGLQEAVQRLRPVYEDQRQYPTTRDVVAKLMGYGGLNGASATMVSALSKFGLLEGHGDTLRVSDLGQDLILHRKGDPEYAAAVQQAAYLPAFFQELREQFPQGLPSEHSLRATLIKRGFNPKAVDGAVRAYRETEQFVANEVEGSERFRHKTESPGSNSSDRDAPVEVERPAAEAGVSDLRLRTITLPYSPSEWASLQAAFPMSEASWDQMMAVLQAMKPALVLSSGTIEPPNEI